VLIIIIRQHIKCTSNTSTFILYESTGRPDDDPIRVETCSRSYKIKVDVFDVHLICCRTFLILVTGI
jgi:hypothetical protein